MNIDLKQYHAQQVQTWLEQTTHGLSVEQLILLFNKVMNVLWLRLRLTLSEITLTPIFERALYISQEKFPLLQHLKIGPEGISFTDLLEIKNELSPSALTQAFKQLLIEIIGIIGCLTAGILTPMLYRELNNISIKDIPSAPLKPIELPTENQRPDSEENQ